MSGKLSASLIRVKLLNSQIFRKAAVSTLILDTERNILQINAWLLQYFLHFVSSRNPRQDKCYNAHQRLVQRNEPQHPPRRTPAGRSDSGKTEKICRLSNCKWYKASFVKNINKK